MTVDFRALISLLAGAGVEFIIVGGAAATAHGSARLTLDLDIVYRRTPANITRLVRSLAPHQPYPRGAPPGLPFAWDEHTVSNGLNFTLTTALGALDLLAEITGGGGYDELLPHSERLELYGVECLCLGLQRLVHVKRAAGRPKDFEAIAELEAIVEERRKLG
jgi:predicted nucleotidyltransferase